MILTIPMLKSGEKEVNALLRFFFVFTILTSSSLSSAQGDRLDSASSNFQPSLFVVIGVLSFMFSLTFILLLYAKLCYREPTAIHINNTNQNRHSNGGMFGAHTRFSGLNIDVVEALPFFRFSSLRGAKQGLQCSVCLAEFEDVEVLRLLPKCKHGFHIECIDRWLESHSTCPLCRQKVSVDDVNSLVNTSFSMRLIMEGKSEAGEASSNFEIFVEREDEEFEQRSIRFNIGESFRRIVKKKEAILPRQNVEECSLHKVNHRILVSDVVFKNRWSDVSSSDLMFLNSEMLGVMSSDRISSSNMSIKEEIERKIMVENKVNRFKRSSSISSSKIDTGFEESRRVMMDRPRARAMSEIASVSRFKDVRSMKNKIRQNDQLNDENNINRRKKWFQIAKRTVQWFANREHHRSQECQDKNRVLDV